MMNRSVPSYQTEVEGSWVYDELKQVRNFRGGFKYGQAAGFLQSGLIGHITKGKERTLRNTKRDSEKTRPASEFEPIEYPKPDGKLVSIFQSCKKWNDHEDQQRIFVSNLNSKCLQYFLSRICWTRTRFCQLVCASTQTEVSLMMVNLNS